MIKLGCDRRPEKTMVADLEDLLPLSRQRAAIAVISYISKSSDNSMR
jgi:hypothetical protein